MHQTEFFIFCCWWMLGSWEEEESMVLNHQSGKNTMIYDQKIKSHLLLFHRSHVSWFSLLLEPVQSPPMYATPLEFRRNFSSEFGITSPIASQILILLLQTAASGTDMEKALYVFKKPIWYMWILWLSWSRKKLHTQIPLNCIRDSLDTPGGDYHAFFCTLKSR